MSMSKNELRLHALAARSRDPRIRRDELRRRASRSADPRLRRFALELRGVVLPFKRPGARTDNPGGACGVCGWNAGADPEDPRRCAACGAWVPQSLSQ